MKEEGMSVKNKEEAIQRGNQYFKDLYNVRAYSEKFYVLENTVQEHELCFSMGWHLEKERHLPSSHWSGIAGGGPLFVSKISYHIGIAGSAMYYDDVGDFELWIQGLEAYPVLVIKFEKKKLSSLKTLLELNTPQLLKKVNEDEEILIEDEDYRLKELQTHIEKAGIICKFEWRTKESDRETWP
ncbi:MAG: hypothetical protein AAFR87_23795 [Bacteroidota bacterium]